MSFANSNAQLVKKAGKIIHLLGAETLTPEEARKALGLVKHD